MDQTLVWTLHKASFIEGRLEEIHFWGEKKYV